MTLHASPDVKANVLCVTTYELGDDSASTRVLNVAGLLRDEGYAVAVHQHVWGSASSDSIERIDSEGGITRRVIVTSRLASFFRHLGWVVRENYDVVIGNNMNGALFSILGRLRAPLVLDLHGDMVAELDMHFCDRQGPPSFAMLVRKPFYRVTDYVTRSVSDRISCVSRKMMSVLRSRGVPDSRLVYVPNCVDLEFFVPRRGPEVDALRSRLGVSRDKLLLGYLGRDHPWQGVENFVKAAHESSDPDLEFLVVGFGERKTRDNIHFVGDVPLAEMPNYYGICDVFVLPRPSHLATRVAAPTKFAEYAAMGRPIIATDVGDAPELIRQYDCGVVINDNNTGELMRGFSRMKELSADARAAMGLNARRLAETEFTLDIARSNLTRCISELTSSSP